MVCMIKRKPKDKRIWKSTFLGLCNEQPSLCNEEFERAGKNQPSKFRINSSLLIVGHTILDMIQCWSFFDLCYLYLPAYNTSEVLWAPAITPWPPAQTNRGMAPRASAFTAPLWQTKVASIRNFWLKSEASGLPLLKITEAALLDRTQSQCRNDLHFRKQGFLKPGIT